MRNHIIQAFSSIDLSISDKQHDQLIRYCHLLIEWNRNINLTAITDPQEVAEKHFLDSCSVLPFGWLQPQFTCADIGSGAGFPGLPLAIMRPDVSFTLIESLQKRVGFLDTVITELGLANCSAVHLRAEQAGRDKRYREQFDITFTRAVSSLAAVGEYCLPLTKVSGCMVAYRGGMEEMASLPPDVFAPLGCPSFEALPARLPNRSHAFCFARKQTPTPDRFPRTSNAIAKRPLF